MRKRTGNVMTGGICLCLAVLFMGGCGTTGVDPKMSTAATPATGNHEQRTYRAPDAHMGPYKAVFVSDPAAGTTSARNVKVEAFLSEMQTYLKTGLQAAMQSSGRFEKVTTDLAEAKTKGKYLVCDSEMQVHFGSTAARLIVGMGAGRSKLIIVMSLKDPETGNVVAKYTGWGGALGGWGEQIKHKMRSDASVIANYFGYLVKGLPE